MASEIKGETAYVVSVSYDYEDSSYAVMAFRSREDAENYIRLKKMEGESATSDYDKCSSCPVCTCGTRKECEKACAAARKYCGRKDVSPRVFENDGEFYVDCEKSAKCPSDEFYFITECGLV